MLSHSSISDKVGELVGAIHLAIVAHEIHNICAGKHVSSTIRKKGLLIHKVIGIIYP